MIAIRNSKTGLEKTFADKQAVADFLHSEKKAADWEGHERLGNLPEPTVETPVEPDPEKVAVDDGKKADESAGRHLVDPVLDPAAGKDGAVGDADDTAAAKAPTKPAAKTKTK